MNAVGAAASPAPGRRAASPAFRPGGVPGAPGGRSPAANVGVPGGPGGRSPAVNGGRPGGPGGRSPAVNGGRPGGPGGRSPVANGGLPAPSANGGRPAPAAWDGPGRGSGPDPAASPRATIPASHCPPAPRSAGRRFRRPSRPAGARSRRRAAGPASARRRGGPGARTAPPPRPSTIAVRTTVPACASARRAVIRRRSPSRW